jgi:hypothetical protein
MGTVDVKTLRLYLTHSSSNVSLQPTEVLYLYLEIHIDLDSSEMSGMTTKYVENMDSQRKK